MVVVAPIRTREVPAIVLLCREVSEERSSIRSSDYAIRKITRAKPRRIWLPAFLKAVEETSDLSAQKLGEVLLALTPKAILDAHLEGVLKESASKETNGKFEILATQGNTKTRYEEYQRLVRESFARHESVFVCVPTEEDVLRRSAELGHGILDYTFSLHSSISKKKIIEIWKNILKEEHAVLVVGTAQYLALPRRFKTIVLDEEHSHAWKTISRPQIDLRVFVEEYARACGGRLIIGAPILRAETHERIANGSIGEFGRISQHAREQTEIILVDPRKEEKYIREKTGRREMVLVSKELLELMQDARERSERVLLLSARKGLAPVTTCSDCGALVRCPQCETPLVVHRKESAIGSAQIFVCHGCGFMRVPENNVNETCPNCKGWKLQGVGIGIDRIDDEIAKLFPKTERFILDSERAKTRAQGKKIIEKFEKSDSGVLIATPMALPLLGSVDNTAIISIDSLFAIPDIRMSERIFALVLALREKTTGTLLIQTRADDTTIFEQALAGDLLKFTENELAIRKAFSYPPYGTIIKITLRGKRAEVASEMERLKTFLETYSPIVPGSIAKEPKNIFRMHMILKLAEGNWPNNELLGKLRALPMQFTIEVNPDHLL
ncbi:MAG: Primosomal protein N' [Parcubacteria group bacterium GW2011_GWA1_44_13]|uniref:Primosomal protein N n=1 Tax=Candidatus Nomurabacteria bacterium GW2011_GWB1_44_12 TaxID=1618748 RepID=A0A837ICJ6_9BACT|nr:MAG: Primosomal protein N' [Candidatus Nomurabacteria bacterium GW2011_GWD1_44_10]KKT36551.1 MAG: Primosomal protein N' [Candidatus Nomurabacteria bacterium GW2011_GWB1_44_12]KKT38178.1 MAG: Primosomal protein N' [Parcubacteria group bacterium GW2011_GWA1_44_13]